MGVLVFRHVPFEDLGLIARALQDGGLCWRYVDWYADPGGDAPWQDAAGLIFMGGPMSANDALDYLRREMDLIQKAASAAVPVLG
ncbi:MAG: type 1 glutamine amidotransferase, partial [Bryobacteraceae bacterium]